MLEGSVQRETSESCRGTFYFYINSNIYQLRFLSKHGAAKVRDPEVVIQTPFRSLHTTVDILIMHSPGPRFSYAL
jgi:hypothetical protein